MSDSPFTLPQPGEIGQFLLNQLNSTVIPDFVTTLNPSMIIDNPLAVYTKLVGKTHQPNKFKNMLDFNGIVLAKVDIDPNEFPELQFLSGFMPQKYAEASVATGVGYFCMVPELHAMMPNPFNFLFNPVEFLKRSVRYPFFTIRTIDAANAPGSVPLNNVGIGSIVNIHFDNSNYTTGAVTKLIAPINLSDIIGAMGASSNASAAFFAGNTVDPNTGKLATTAERTGFTTDQLLTMINTLVVGGALTSDWTPNPPGRIHPVSGKLKPHNGIDIGATLGVPVLAAHDSYIDFIGFDSGGGGNMIRLVSEDGITITRYMHLSGFNINKSESNFIEKGQIIGTVGSTGLSSGPHLHFEVQKPGFGGPKIDPWTWLATENGIPLEQVDPENVGDTPEVRQLEEEASQTSTESDDPFLDQLENPEISAAE
jgi:murein DD-endopeptidase MepM/ murein hydrolase activator NlpD